MKKSKVQYLLLVLAVILLVLGIGLTGLAATVMPTYIDENDPTFGSCIKFKPYENAQAGSFTESDGTLTVEFTISADLKTLNWKSNIPVSHVFVKGGQGGNDYFYEAGATQDTGLIAPEGKDISHVTFYYCTPEPETVTLIVNKHITDEIGNSLDEDSTHKNVSFTVNVNGTSYTVSAASPLVLTDLTPGDFTVQESTELPENYSYVSGNETVTINSGTGTVTIINKYTPPSVTEKVSLIVNKNIVDANGNSLNEDSVHKDTEFTVNVNGKPYKVKASAPLTLSDLEPGTFEVAESSVLPANYSYVGGNKTVQIDEGTAVVTITNRYTPPSDPETVTLIVRKEIKDMNGKLISEDAAHKDVEFTVTVNGKAYALKASAPLVLSGLTPGTFTVKETTLPLKYTYVSGNETIAVNSGTATITITNRYEPELPKTNGSDILTIVLGMLCMAGGFLLRKRVLPN